jgi:hypothetical protein
MALGHFLFGSSHRVGFVLIVQVGLDSPGKSASSVHRTIKKTECWKGVSFFRANSPFLTPIPMQIGLVPNEHNPTVNRWRFVMKTLLTLGAALAVLLLIAMPVASQAPQADKSFSGTLTKVDAAKKVITVKGTGAELAGGHTPLILAIRNSNGRLIRKILRMK